ncbi:MAG: nitrogen regulation protein NR(II) [Gammaproteobacteria bacterium]|nr:PAS domain-containing sensor histidine kinase [Chromatiales bacterium]MDP6673746.1 nitrogen regulation protein NR(II) [Gammaproteobacteria bacterium]
MVLSAEEILENLATAIFVLTKEQKILLINAAAEAMFGISRKQAAGQSPTDLIPELQPLESLFDRTQQTGQSFGRNLSFTVPQRDFATVQAACRVSPLTESAPEQLIIEFFDAIHWRQRDKEKALFAQRGASRRIIRQLAHEIRNPLGGLRGAAQLLERRLNDPDLDEYTRVIISEADRLVALTENLLGPSRQPALKPMNIHEPLEHVLLLIENEAPAGIQFIRDYDPSLPVIDLDRDQIIQVFLNLARNAIQAMGETGQITIRTRALTNFVIDSHRHRLTIGVEFEDNGLGISADIEDSIFYPLVTDREGGTGLGLPLAQDLVSRHGGVIEFESEPECTRFMVRLPLQPQDQSS